MKIVFVGGGTGGHFYPLVAVAEVIKTYPNPPSLYYIGPYPYEPALLTSMGIEYIYCPAGKVRLYFSILNFLDVFRNFFGIFVALFRLFSLYPDVIFSKGSYTSVPVLIAAKLLRIPVVIHESDAVPGRANNLAKGFARYIAISYPDTISYFNKDKVALTGIPLRQAVKYLDPNPYATLGIPADLPLIYVTGGSSGAERINNLILRCLDDLLPYYRIYHQTGTKQVDDMALAAKSLITDPILQSRYYIQGHIEAKTVNALLSCASVVITRAGSTTLFEAAVHGRPSIVIPIPEDISRDQRTNAYAYARTGAATVIEEGNLTESLLVNEIHSIIQNPANWQQMSAAASSFAPTDAAEKIATTLIKIGVEHRSYKA